VTLEDLRVFVAVCELGSFSAVARKLGCTQPAVSQHIARLERELETSLLERSSTGVTPTGAGKTLQEAALDGLDSIASGIRRIAELRDGEVGSLSITTGGSSVRHFMRETVIGFRERHPGIRLHFVPTDSTQSCLEILRRSSADLALVTIGEPVRGIEHRAVAEQAPRLIVCNDDPLASRKKVSIRELSAIRYISLTKRATSYAILQDAFEREGLALEATMSVDDFDTACVFVELGLGHAIVPAMHAHHFSQGGRVASIEIRGLKPVVIGWAVRRWSSLSSAANTFVEIFHHEMKQHTGVPGLSVID
jgi:DNA-binding transcriptional LysR family regulator